MNFLSPYMLWFLLLVPVLIAGYVLAQRRRQHYAVRYSTLSLVKQAAGKGPGRRRHIPPFIFLLAVSVMLLALARPVTTVSFPAQEGTVMLAIDTSGSMAATDLTPTRMEAAKAAARGFVQNQPSNVRIGLVSYSDSAFVVQGPTTDRQALLGAIDQLYPQRGTAIGRGLVAAIMAIFESPVANTPSAASPSNGVPNGMGFAPFLGGDSIGTGDSLDALPPPSAEANAAAAASVVILLTDGENNMGPDPSVIAQQASQRGIRIYTVGIGSKQGSTLEIDGQSVVTRLDEDLLTQIAQTANGLYYNAQNASDLQRIYQDLGTRLVVRTEKTEVTAFLTGAAILLSVIGASLSLFWFSRLP